MNDCLDNCLVSLWLCVCCGILQNLNMSPEKVIFHNKMIILIVEIPPRAYLGCSVFTKINILHVNYRADQIKLSHMLNIVHGSALEYLKHSITLSRGNRYDTRSGNIPCIKYFGIKSFPFSWHTMELSQHNNTLSGVVINVIY